MPLYYLGGCRTRELYHGVGQSDSDSGIAKVIPPAYFGQPRQLQPAMNHQVAGNLTGYPPPLDTGTWAASAPSWNHSTGSWVRAPQAASVGALPNISAERWEVGFKSEACRMQPPIEPVGAPQLNHVATPPEYGPHVISTPWGARTTCQLLKLQPFDGCGSLDTFLLVSTYGKLHVCCNEEDVLNHLRRSLEEAAGQVLWEVGPHAMTANIIRLLQKRFGKQLQVECFKAELGLQARRRAPGESLHSRTYFFIPRNQEWANVILGISRNDKGTDSGN